MRSCFATGTLLAFSFVFGFLSITNLYASEFTYEVDFQGVPSLQMEETMESLSRLIADKALPIGDIQALRQRAEDDKAILLKILNSEGYFDGKINFIFQEEPSHVRVTINVSAGARYTLASYQLIPEFSIEDEDPLYPSFPLETIELELLGLQLGQPAAAEGIISAEDRLLTILANRGYPLALIVDKSMVADRSSKSLTVTLIVDTGPEVTFGETAVNGLRKVREEFIRRKIAWLEGERFSPRRIRETTEDLEDSGLFSSVLIDYSQVPTSDYSLPMQIQVRERLHRTLAAGINYRTDRGPGLISEWENRNLRGMGELLNFRLDLRDSDQDGTLRYRKNDFGVPGQSLQLIGNVQQERTENYSVMSLSATALIEKIIDPELKIFYGASIKKQKTSKSDNNQTNTLLNAPIGFTWRSTDSDINPSEGTVINLSLTPNYDIEHGDTFFLKQWLTCSGYMPLSGSERFILALQMTMGTILGSSRIDVPPPDRFYAGDENLLRGYSYHTVSPLDSKNDPLGGRSLLVIAAEARLKINQNWGWVAFLEAGNVYSSSLPNLGGDQLRSAGLGLRYHTPIGPLRLDVAFPFDKRKGVDSDFEVYLSIGHTF